MGDNQVMLNELQYYTTTTAAGLTAGQTDEVTQQTVEECETVIDPSSMLVTTGRFLFFDSETTR